MEQEQVFTKENIEKLQDLCFNSTIGKKIKTLSKFQSKKISKILLLIGYFCLLVVFILEKNFSDTYKDTKFLSLIILTSTMCFFISSTVQKKFENKLNIQYQNLYGYPFMVKFDEKCLLYKATSVSYQEIQYIVFYDEFIFIFTGKKIMVLKRTEEVINFLKGKSESYKNITCREEKSPFSFKKYLMVK